jgi:hypothetical protein
VRAVTKVALGVGASLVAVAVVVVLQVRPSLANGSVDRPSPHITAPITIDPIPNGLATPPVNAQRALDTACNGTGSMMEFASNIEVHLVTVSMLQRSGISLPVEFNGAPSEELWMVSINGLNMPPAGPVGGTNLAPHHQLNVVVDARTGASVELYSTK